MPKKEKDNKNKGDSAKKQTKNPNACLANKSPGPARYLLPTLTGYPKHDITKYRNPAYSFRNRQTSQPPCNSPGPKYGLSDKKMLGFTFGYRGTSSGKSCTPGPYRLPDNPPSFKFSFGRRTNPRSGGATPGPYVLPSFWDCDSSFKSSPCFTFGARPCGTRCDGGPGPKYGVFNKVKGKPPGYCTFGRRQTGTISSCGPGPKYKYCYKCSKCGPNFSFGIRHSECAPPMITECDEKC